MMTHNRGIKAVTTMVVVSNNLSFESSMVVLLYASNFSNNDSIELAGVSMVFILLLRSLLLQRPKYNQPG